MQSLWTVARAVYGLFFLATGLWVLLSIATGLLPAPGQPTPAASAFMQALDDARFVTPMLGLSYIAGGGCLLFTRTAPLGLVLLAPSVAVILGFHLFLSGQYVWGPFVTAYFLLLVWRYRRSLAALWSGASS
jgi:hypothetical protein